MKFPFKYVAFLVALIAVIVFILSVCTVAHAAERGYNLELKCSNIHALGDKQTGYLNLFIMQGVYNTAPFFGPDKVWAAKDELIRDTEWSNTVRELLKGCADSPDLPIHVVFESLIAGKVTEIVLRE